MTRTPNKRHFRKNFVNLNVVRRKKRGRKIREKKRSMWRRKGKENFRRMRNRRKMLKRRMNENGRRSKKRRRKRKRKRRRRRSRGSTVDLNTSLPSRTVSQLQLRVRREAGARH